MITARCGSARTSRAPNDSSEPSQNIRASYIHSWMRTVPSACVANAAAMLVRSEGNPGQTCDCTFGIFPPSACSMTYRSFAGTWSSSPSTVESMPSRLNTARIIPRCCGAQRWTVSSPWVIAARPMNEPTSW